MEKLNLNKLNIEQLSLEEKIAQMLIISLKENEITKETINMIQKYKIGGIILYRKDYKSYAEMLKTINKLKEISRINKIPLLISIDQEGGRVNRMPPEIKNFRSASKIAETGNLELIDNYAQITARMLKSMGIDMNYAPVLDIKRFEDEHAIGNRCFGKDEIEVSKYGIEFMKETINNGVIPVIKHFPGHGATTKNSHISLPVINRKIEELEKKDIYPFKKAIENGAEAIMVGHLVIRAIDNKPASLSKMVIQEYLKNKYKFNGLIMTDDINMWAIKLRYSPTKAVELAIKSGNDMIMGTLEYNKIQKVIKNIAKKVERGKIEISQINNSVEKIINFKEKYNVNDNEVKGFNIQEINEKIEQVNKKVEDNEKI